METSMICALPDDLLLRILQLVPTKDAVTTSILSQRWRYVWTMLPRLDFRDEDISESLVSLKFRKASRLHKLIIGVKYLVFKLLCTAKPTRLSKSLYTSEALVNLALSNQILVDVSSPARLPSLKYLMLEEVVYKDEDSLNMLLSSSPVLKSIWVHRHKSDNLKTFTVKVSSLEKLTYTSNNWTKVEVDEDDLIGSLVIDSPALKKLFLWDVKEKYYLIDNMHCLDLGFISFVYNLDLKFMRSLSSVRQLFLFLTKSMVACCYTIKFSRLIEFYFIPDPFVDWLNPLVVFLQNSPNLQTLTIDNEYGGPPPSWNQPRTVPECLSNHLEVFGWKDYEGREGEKQLLTYILANSKCLKTLKISFKATRNLEETQKEVESMPRISTSSRLLFSPKTEWQFNGYTY